MGTAKMQHDEVYCKSTFGFLISMDELETSFHWKSHLVKLVLF
jgi:hypothetical protein